MQQRRQKQTVKQSLNNHNKVHFAYGKHTCPQLSCTGRRPARTTTSTSLHVDHGTRLRYDVHLLRWRPLPTPSCSATTSMSEHEHQCPTSRLTPYRRHHITSDSDYRTWPPSGNVYCRGRHLDVHKRHNNWNFSLRRNASHTIRV